jgi:hypothetical protein
MTHPNKREVHAKEMELNQKRQVANQTILRKLTDYLQANPSMRFSQALSNLDIVQVLRNVEGMRILKDEYYLESEEVLKRI